MSTESPQAPDATFVRQRWIPRDRVQWATESNVILMEHGAVTGSVVYRRRHQARWRAQSLIKLLVELRIHERWQLSEHIDQKAGGYMWTVEYVPRRRNG